MASLSSFKCFRTVSAPVSKGSNDRLSCPSRASHAVGQSHSDMNNSNLHVTLRRMFYTTLSLLRGKIKLWDNVLPNSFDHLLYAEAL
jgi:hypothetical protein